MVFKSLRTLFSSSKGKSRTASRGRKNSRNKPYRLAAQLGVEGLEERMLLSAPDLFSLGNVCVPATSEGGQVSGSYFLGGSFDTGNQSIGSIASTPVGQFGAELNLNLSGQVGVDLGYSASTGGQVNANYKGISLQQNYSEPTQFNQQVNFTPDNTNVSYQSGSFSTTGPSLSTSANLVANVNGSIGGTFAFFGSVSGSSSFSTNINQPIYNVGIGSTGNSNGNDAGLTLNVLGTDLSEPLNELASSPGLSVSVNPAGPEIPVFISGSVNGSTSPLGLHEGLSLGVGEGEGDQAVGGSIQLGSADQYIPDITLNSDSLQDGGVLTDSEQGNLADLNIQAGPVVAALLGEAGFPGGAVAALAGSDTLSVGSASVTFTPISFQVGPNLTLAQTSTITPTNQLTYSFTNSSGQAIAVDVTKDGQDLGLVSSVTFTPGVDNLGIKFAGTPITVTPTWNFTENYTDELDLDVSFQGSLTAGSLSASFGDLSTPTLGPLYSQNYDFADYKIATIYDNTTPLATETTTLPSFVIGSSFNPSLNVTQFTDSDAPGSLRGAVESANLTNSATPQIIHLGPGTYNLTISPNSSGAGSSGALYVTAQNLIIEGAGPGQTIINASGMSDRVFNVAAGANLTLTGVTIENGTPEGTIQSDDGGGIYNAGTLTVSDSTISGSLASNGGGIYNAGMLTVSDSTVSDNAAFNGAGIQNAGTLLVTNSAIIDNPGYDGGGGGIGTSAGTAEVIDSTISGNADLGGGGVYAYGTGELALDNCTITNNSAAEGGGLDDAFGPSVLLDNTIIAGNNDYGASDIEGTVSNLSANNLIGDGNGESGISNGNNGNLIGTQNAFINPLLAPLGNYGGPTETMPLLSGSPAIAAGTSIVPGGLPVTDQRGFARTLNGQVDIGAVQYQYDLGLSGYLTSGTAPDTAEYVYTVTNNGPDPVAGATLAVPLPQGTTFQSLNLATGWTETDPGAGNNGTVVYTDTSNLNAGQSANFTIAVQLQSTGVGATLNNAATVGPTMSDSNPQNNSVTLTITNEQEGQNFPSAVELFHFVDSKVPVVGIPTVSIGPVSPNGTGPLGNGTYYYTVTSTTATGESPASSEVSATTAGELNHVTLIWNQVSGATGYKVYRGTSPGAESTLIATITSGNTLSFTDTGFEATSSALPPRTNPTFTAFVAWGDNSGNTSNDGSGTVSVVADPNGGFDVIGSHAYAEEGNYGTTVVVSGTDGTAYSNSSQQNPAVSQPLSNTLLYHFADANIPIARVPGVSNSDGSLAAATYYYTVTSTSGTGESPSSNVVSATTTGNNSEVTISWSQVAGATGYKVYRGNSPGAENTLIATINSASTASFTDDGTEAISSASPPTNIFTASVAWGDNSSNLSNNGSGAISVIADPNGGFDVYGSHVYAAAGSYAIAVAVTGSDGTQSNGGLAYDSALTPQQQFTNAVLYHFTDDNSPIVGSPTVSVGAVMRNGLGALGNATYYYTVTSTTATGESPTSNEVSATTASELNHVMLTWNQVSGATGYKVYRGTSPGAENTLISTITSGSTLAFLDTGTEATSSASPPSASSLFFASVAWGDNSSNTSSDGSGAVSVVADPNGGFDVIGSHAYAAVGSYGIAVTVSGTDGTQTNGSLAFNSGLAPQQLFVVADAPLTAGALTPPPFATINQTISNALLFHFTDADPNGTVSDYMATITWGDGTTSSSTGFDVIGSNGIHTVSIVADPDGGFDVLGSHTYAQIVNAGTFSVQVSDFGGSSTGASDSNFQVQAPDQPLTAGALNVPSVTTEGQSINNQLLFHFSDPDADAQASDYLATAFWGDGSGNSSNDGSGSVSVVSNPNGGFDVVGSHVFVASSGVYFAVKVTDLGDPRSSAPDLGGQITGAVSATPLTIVDPPVVVTAGQTFTDLVNTLSAVQTVATFTDPGGPDTSAFPVPYIATIQWGDGNITVASETAQASYANATVSDDGKIIGQIFSAESVGGIVLGSDGQIFSVDLAHEYANQGNYTITILLDHEGVLSQTVTTTALVAGLDNLTATAGGSITSTFGAGISDATVATFTDTNIVTTASAFTATITWGDGQSSFGTLSGGNGNFTVTGNHNYANVGNYPIGVTISNLAGTATAMANTSATINPAAPTLTVSDAGGTYNGNPFSATATAVGIDGTTPVAGSFSYAYYAGDTAMGTPSQTAPSNAGIYTVVATFTSGDANYTGGDAARTTFTISPAQIRYAIGNDSQIYGYPANLAADLPSIFNTGINGETLHITFSSSGDTSTAKAGAYAITGVVSNGTGLASNYAVTLTNGTLTVLGSGVSVAGSELWIVGGPNSNDNIQINPVGASSTGSTGVQVQATLNGVYTSTTFNQSFTTINIILYAGNDNIQLAPTLTINAKISAGNGNDNVQLDAGPNALTLGNGNDNVQAGNGNNTVTLGGGNDNINAGSGNNTITAGNGNDNVTLGSGGNALTLGSGNDNVNAGNGNNTITAGNGNDNVTLGSGSNVVTLGSGNDNVNAGSGNNVILEGNGNDNINAGNGDNLIVAGLGQHNVSVGNGSNILIDGSVQLTQSGDSLGQVLADWIQYGEQAANVASIRSRLDVTYNTHHANNLNAGGGLDWFWATDALDHLNANPSDLRN